MDSLHDHLITRIAFLQGLVPHKPEQSALGSRSLFGSRAHEVYFVLSWEHLLRKQRQILLASLDASKLLRWSI